MSRTATAGLLLGVFAIGSQSLLLSPVLQDVARSFGVDEAAAAYALTAYGLSLAVCAPAVGFMGDAVSRRVAIVAGLAGFAAAGAAGALAPSLATLVAAQSVCGLAAGAFLPSTYALVGDETPYAQRAKVMGRVMFGWAAAMVLGVPLGGFLGERTGWRGALLAVSALALLATGLSAAALPRRTDSGARPAGGTVASRLRRSVREALGARATPALLIVNLLNMTGFYGAYAFLGAFLRERLQVGAGGAGALVIAYGFGLALITLNAGLLDRIGKPRALLAGLAGVAVVLATLPYAPAGGWPAVAIAMAAWGVLQGACVTSLTTIVTQQSESARGAVTALMSGATYLGVAAGSGLVGRLYMDQGFAAVGLACALLSLGAALLFWRIRSEVRAG